MDFSKKESFLILGILLIALLVRIPYFDLLPEQRYDEVEESFLSLTICPGGTLRLVHLTPYIGVVFHYLQAGVLCTLGVSAQSMRLLPIISGVITVFLTYVLARQIFGKREAFWAGLFIALAASHIYVASHVGWSASIAPPLALASFILYFAWKEKKEGKFLFVAFLMLALMLQAHPSTLPIFAAIALSTLFELFSKKNKAKFALLGASALGLTIGYLNVIVHNIIKPLDSVYFAASARWTGFRVKESSSEILADRALCITNLMSKSLYGIFMDSNPLAIFLYYLPWAGAVILGFYGKAKELALGLLLYVPMLMFGTICMATTHSWGPHYIQPMLPLIAVVLSASFEQLIKTASLSKGQYKKALEFAAVFSVFLFIGIPLIQLAIYYQGQKTSEIGNYYQFLGNSVYSQAKEKPDFSLFYCDSDNFTCTEAERTLSWTAYKAFGTTVIEQKDLKFTELIEEKCLNKKRILLFAAYNSTRPEAFSQYGVKAIYSDDFRGSSWEILYLSICPK
jgi:4-amino-4-deoxy-L-arabinose transferase-like glycosyltransferase